MTDTPDKNEGAAWGKSTPETEVPQGTLHPFPRDTAALASRQRLTCRLTTLRSEPGLSRAAVQYLAEEMPDIEFCLDERGDCDVIWLVGYEEGADKVISELRSSHPTAKILVTKRGPAERWGGRVLEAGADYACAWPVPGHRLSDILHGRRVRQII